MADTKSLAKNIDNQNHIKHSSSVWHRFHNTIKLTICKLVWFSDKEWEQFDLSWYIRQYGAGGLNTKQLIKQNFT